MENGTYTKVKNYLIDGTLPSSFPSTKSNFIALCSKFSLNKKTRLIRDNRIVLKESEIEKIFRELHQHSGRNKTYQKFRERFWFPSMSVWVREKVRECVPCSNKNNLQWPAHRAPLMPIPVEPKLWWRVHVDLIGPLPRSTSGNCYISLAVCALSKYVEAKGNKFYIFYTYFPGTSILWHF